MKNWILFCVVLTILGLGSVAAEAQCNNRYDSTIKCSYYDEGYTDGGNDARSYQSNDYTRYRSKYEKKYETYYKTGYQAGYLNAGIPNNGGSGYVRWTNSQKNAYNSGYDIGQSDRRRSNAARIPENYNTHDSQIGLYFQQGYNDGFANTNRRYDFPITSQPWPGNGGGGWPGNGGGNWPGNGGNGNGTATWTGRVDDRANIIIRGGNIRTEDVSGTGLQIYTQNVNGSLPFRPVTVKADKRSGRGTVYVLQQPDRNNGFTAIVQILDNKGGQGDYSVDISWSGSGGGQDEQYSSGRVIWSGRVDQTATIRINGSYVDSQDSAGTGLSNVHYDINGYLAHRNGSVNVNKRNGRGTVTVLQQPSRFNDYTAVIQVFDPSGGADNYEVEISW